ncbi:MAG TPA: thiamine diphosphokinase [Chloroflexota bacterium]|nr:thiamine diphosphokinase [Chloroflexota bacterium]
MSRVAWEAARCDAVVIAHGSAGDAAWGRALVAGARLVVAADGGARTALRWGRAPDVVVGDLDSLDARARRALERAGCAFEVHPRDKDETDAELALLAAVRRGATSIAVAGALGGERLDHALANVLLLGLPALRGVPVALVDPRHEVRLLRGPESIALRGARGDYVSLLPLGGAARGITTAGLRYRLEHGTLAAGPARGVSNELVRRRATVTVGRGALLVVLHRRGSGGEAAVPQAEPAGRGAE